MADFAPALKVILVHEGGLVDDPDDPGGVTDYGISLRFLKDHGLDLDGDGDVDADDVRGLTPEKAGDLYRQFFWKLVHGDDLGNQELASKLVDVAVNVGPPRAIRIAQAAAGVPADGCFGPQTFAALNVDHPTELLKAVVDGLVAFYEGIAANKPKSAKFLAGWLVRARCTTSNPCKTCRARLK